MKRRTHKHSIDEMLQAHRVLTVIGELRSDRSVIVVQELDASAPLFRTTTLNPTDHA